MTPGQVQDVVRERLGLDPGSLGTAEVLRAVDGRVRATRSAGVETYLALLQTPAEVNALAAELAVPETWFFRGGRRLFDALAEFVFRRTARGPSRPARVLSIPCSTGEEPYSLAVALHERNTPPDGYRVDGVDVSATHLDRATVGRYPDSSFRETGLDPRPLHFRPAGDRWELLPHLRALVHFRAGNATDPAFLADESPYDLIVCRNLFIYLSADGRKRVMAHLDRLLAADGMLCLSAAEADRLPPARFAPDGPPEFFLFRRAGAPASGVKSGVFVAPPLPSPGSRLVPKGGSTCRAAVPELPRPTFDTARSLADAGKLTEARTACERACAAHPDSADGYALLGVIHQAEGNVTAAADAFRKALYLAPEHPEALTHLAALADRRGDAEQAAALRRRLARLAAREGNP